MSRKQRKARRFKEKMELHEALTGSGGRQPRKRPVSESPIPNPVVNINDFRKKSVDISPRNHSQQRLVESLNNHNTNIVFATGPAGTGKTHIATLYAIKQFKEGKIKKIVITRPNVAVDDRDIGFLPGGVYEKMAPWMRPVLDIFEEFFSPMEIEIMMENNIIEICPIAFMRGRTFKHSVIIIDEAQGTTVNSLKAILTRIGEGSKMVITGDVEQSDIGAENGLADFINKYDTVGCYSDMVKVVRFKHSEIERHPVVEHILKLYGDIDRDDSPPKSITWDSVNYNRD